jgi:Putative Ig domain
MRLVDVVAEPTSVTVASARLLGSGSGGFVGGGAVNLVVLTDARANFNYTVPCRTVSACDANERPIFAARSEDGSPLPQWLNFDPNTATFSGQAPAQTPALKVQVSTAGAVGSAAWTDIQLNFVGPAAR